MNRSNINVGSAAHVVVSLAVGALVLAGFFAGGNLGILVELLSSWTTDIVAFALLLGLANVVRIHMSKVITLDKDWVYSAVLIGSMLAVIFVGLFGNQTAGDPAVQWMFQWLYQPVAASLSALLVFFIISAAFRSLRAGPSTAWVMLGVALLVMLGSAAWSRAEPLAVLSGTRDWLMSYPVMAGMRGIMLGAALGAVATSLRILLGIDRPGA